MRAFQEQIVLIPIFSLFFFFFKQPFFLSFFLFSEYKKALFRPG